jgi:hypothetical protein
MQVHKIGISNQMRDAMVQCTLSSAQRTRMVISYLMLAPPKHLSLCGSEVLSYHNWTLLCLPAASLAPR